MKTFLARLKPLGAVLAGLLLAAPAAAVELDFSGSNIYMKFLDGDHQIESAGSIDTASGSDQGQFSELELRLTARVSRQVEAGARVQSRSSGGYWSEFGFADENTPIKAKNMKLRGAYINLTPGYDWLNQLQLGSSDWGMFDPFTVGKMRYIDRDNINGVYARGPLPMDGSSYELAWISLAQYLGPNFSTTDGGGIQKNDGTWVTQLKLPVPGARLVGSYQFTEDRERDPTDANPYDGTGTITRFRNEVVSLRAETSPIEGLDLRLAGYYSDYDVAIPVFDWSNLLGDDETGTAFLATVDWATPFEGLGLSFQAFDIGAGYVSAVAARRESDVLLTEGSESAWYGWGDPKYIGGLANDMWQVPITIRDNDFHDFDETGAESAIGWKGVTALVKLDLADTPMSGELTFLDYNQNWQDWGGDQQIYNVISWAGPTGPNFKEDTDRQTMIAVFKLSKVLPVLGGLDVGFKAKLVADDDNGAEGDATDDRETTDTGFSITAGNQLFADLYGSVSLGHYVRDITVGTTDYDNDKDILSLRLAYNLTGFELGTLVQWIDGTGDPNTDGVEEDVAQYRLKAFAKVIW